MKKLILQPGKLSSLYVNQGSENENVFGVELFLGDPEKPSVVFDLTAMSHDSALKLFRTIETHVSESNVQLSLANFAPEILEMMEEQGD